MTQLRLTVAAPHTGGRRRCCVWCAVELSGLRRWGARACRECAPRLYGSAGIYLSAGGPSLPHLSRAGQIEPLPLLRLLRWGAPRPTRP